MSLDYVENNSIVSKYVRALYDVAKGRGIEKKILEQLKNLKKCIGEMENFEEILKRASLVKNFGIEFVEILKQHLGLSAEIYNFLSLIRINKRLPLLMDFCCGYEKFIDEIEGKKKFLVTTFEPINDPKKKKLEKTLQQVFGGKIEMDLKQDPSIIGGMIVQHRSKILDYSVKSRITRLHEAIRRENYEN